MLFFPWGEGLHQGIVICYMGLECKRWMWDKNFSAFGLGNDRRSDGDEFGELFPSGVENTFPTDVLIT